jgi:hypothetical protein
LSQKTRIITSLAVREAGGTVKFVVSAMSEASRSSYISRPAKAANSSHRDK